MVHSSASCEHTADTLRRMFLLNRGRWDDFFHERVVAELASLVEQAHERNGMPAVERTFAYLEGLRGQATTHEEIAAGTGLHRVTVSRALEELERVGRVLRKPAEVAAKGRVYQIVPVR